MFGALPKKNWAGYERVQMSCPTPTRFIVTSVCLQSRSHSLCGHMDSPCPLISCRTLVVLFLLCSFGPVEGQYQVIGPTQTVVAAPGDDVILPCHVEPHYDVVGLTVEWSRPDLQPDPKDPLGQVEYVLVYRDAKEDLDLKLPAYYGRTRLFSDGLRRGNISLKIMNVTLEDKGRYKCFIPKLEGETKSSVVHLVVEPNSSKTQTTETPLPPSSSGTPTATEETAVHAHLQLVDMLTSRYCREKKKTKLKAKPGFKVFFPLDQVVWKLLLVLKL
uniref:myelin-oligodendrocyte glycoprotein-like isoform X2 n=1 Tax=Scatophagus argus TaxID=75038 RepID=UPI001ED802CC|nr:myelin-oligodendrocyte glycoprotein-like isoform X2 [Scatophagus argus]